MDWRQVRVAAVQHQADDIEALLWSEGALSVTLTPRDAPELLEPGPGETPLWQTLTVTALFGDDVDTDAVAGHLGARGLLCSADDLEDRVWEREWLRYFRPMRFGTKLWVSPTGFEVPDPGATVVWLDPGLAFGTGTHPTTALCLDWLDANLESGACVIDYGCGSGVLGVAAALLGAERVVCIDNDPQALDATYANAARNGIEVECGLPDQQLPEADVVLANILAGPLIELRPKLCGAVRAGGSVVLSGIKSDQGPVLQDAYAGDLDALEATEREGWLRLTGRRRA